ncbi:MAG: insulinase family protein [Christensenellaceae bacterium]|jgi:predicted Zn-dependent peptidase|nr:insulinase family protein [Christensenellaceae bacterium]
MQVFDRATLPNGLAIVGERMPFLRSVSLGVWLRNGSADEKPEENGYSHFVEHMLFKGTERRSARQIAEEMDFLGGQMNAFTSKELTCFYVKVVSTRLKEALGLLSDLVLNPTFPQDELEKEKGVILEEIAMGEDTPEDLAQDQLALAMFGGHSLGRSILGPADGIRAVSRRGLLGFMKARYKPQNAVLTLAGNYDWDETLRLLGESFAPWAGEYQYRDYPAVEFAPRTLFRQKELEQTQICLAFPSLPLGDEANFSLLILNNLLGGSMSSRLFQRIREQAGLAYSVYSYPSSHARTGIETLYAGTSPKTAQRVLNLMGEELRRLVEGGIPAEEFEKSREQIRGGYLLSMESGSARMQALGRGQLLLGRLRSEEEYLRGLDAANLEEAAALCRKIFLSPFGASIVGPEDLDFSALSEALHG